MKLFAAVTMVVGIAACTSEEPTCRGEDGIAVMNYDPASFTSEELARFPAVEMKWNAFAGHRVVRFEADAAASGACTVRKNPAYGVGKEHLGRESAQGIDVGVPYDCQTVLLQGVDCFEAIVLHETGHAIGIHGHTVDDSSVMYKQTRSIYFGAGDEQMCTHAGICAP